MQQKIPNLKYLIFILEIDNITQIKILLIFILYNIYNMIDLNLLPNKTGVYQFFNKKKQIIYIGKAKDIKKRVSQYFKTGSHKSEYFKSLIFDVEWIVTKSENEALLLEINLIKTHKPRFNIIFKDDKTYPYICLIEKDNNLKLETRRAKLARLKNCFGPFAAGSKPFQTTRMMQELYKIKKCKIKDESRCVYTQLDQCVHLTGKNLQEHNKTTKKNIINFFKGKDEGVRDFVINKMNHFSNLQEYEIAAKYKEMLKRFEIFQEQQTIYSEKIENADYIGYEYFQNTLAIFIIHVREGKIINTFSKKYDVVGGESEALFNFLLSFYQANPEPEFVYIDKTIKNTIRAKNKIPKIGQKRKLLDMANANAGKLISSVIQAQNKSDNFEYDWSILGNFLGIASLHNIEIYDASHISGDSYTGAKVEFEYGKYNPAKTRRYNLSRLSSSNDVKSIEIMLEKRFRNNREVPNIIIVDGSVAQINSAKRTLYKMDINCKVLGLVKNSKHKTKELIDHKGKKHLIKNLVFKNLLIKMQEQVHKTAIVYHRSKRKQKLLKK